MDLSYLLSINNTIFTFMGYQMSYIEFIGTLLNIWSVWLVSKKNIYTWPVGIVAVILFMILFYQIQLYSDFIEQIYFLITGFFGWWVWIKAKPGTNAISDVAFSTKTGRFLYLGAIGLGTLAMGYFMSHIHIYFPQFFPEPAAFPYLDAFTTIMSFTATILMIYKMIDSWIIWIIVDVIGIWLYYSRGVKFISVLYAIFLILATKGLLHWYSLWKAEKNQ